MCGRRSTPFFLVLTFLAAFFVLSGRVLAAVAQVFSVDPASPLAALGSPANLYSPGPALYAPAGSIDLLAGCIQVDYGFSAARNPRNPSYGGCP